MLVLQSKKQGPSLQQPVPPPLGASGTEYDHGVESGGAGEAWVSPFCGVSHEAHENLVWRNGLVRRWFAVAKPQKPQLPRGGWTLVHHTD